MLRIAANMNFHVVDYAADDEEEVVVHGRHVPEVQLRQVAKSSRKRERERDFLNFAFKEET